MEDITPHDFTPQVSILTRPEGRVQCRSRSASTATDKFQSSPGPKAGCNEDLLAIQDIVSWVSILTRPEGRVQ